MVIQHNALPDCTLSALRFGNFPSDLRRPFLREAAKACARYLMGGGDLQNINPDTSHFRNGSLILLPLPPGAPKRPPRTEVETGLITLEARWSPLGFCDSDRLRFFLGLCDALAKSDPLWLSWSRLWLARRERDLSLQAREYFKAALKNPAETPPENGAFGLWRGQVETEAPVLLHAIQQLTVTETALLKTSRRARVWSGTLLGEEVVIKRFVANPRRWRQGLGYSRARHAWAGSLLLKNTGLATPDVLGFVERMENHVPAEGYIIHRVLPDTQPFHTWLRKHLPTLDTRQREHLRHQLREELLRLYRRGVFHKDTKTHNLLVRENPDGSLRFWWIDLEDIRAPGRVGFRHLIRNLYQLNGSVPRRLPDPERFAFVRGFCSRYPFAAHPRILRFIEFKTRIRLRRELNRVCTS